MSGDFLGTYTVSVYKDKYIVIPAAFKKDFSPASQNEVVITNGPTHNIAIYPIDNWNLLTTMLSNENRREQLSFMLENACKAQFEQKNGRLKLEDHIKNIADITDQVVIKGEGSYISVWNPQRYQEHHDNIMKKYKDAFTAMDYRL
jgi:DNA-binding transcriptional regulator/RsmH inhibitor MraZ